MEVIHLGLQNQKSVVHAINGPSTNIHPALLTAVDTCWVPILYHVTMTRRIYCNSVTYVESVMQDLPKFS